jgi:hypothetical protein
MDFGDEIIFIYVIFPELGTIAARPEKFPSGKERKTQLKIAKKPLLQLK